MWSKKWYLKRNISCDAHLLNELLETDVPWDDTIVVSAGKPRKLWDSLSELRSSVWKTTGKGSSEACAMACQNWAVYSVFPSGMTSHSKIAQFNWKCTGRLRKQCTSRHAAKIRHWYACCIISPRKYTHQLAGKLFDLWVAGSASHMEWTADGRVMSLICRANEGNETHVGARRTDHLPKRLVWQH